MTRRAEMHQIDSVEQFTEFVYEQGWTDGLPVFPPARQVVEGMVSYLGRDPGEVLGTVFPGDGEATIENIAAKIIVAMRVPAE